MLSRVWDIRRQAGNSIAFYVDAANPVVWQALKREFKERYDPEYVRTELNRYRSLNLNPANYMTVISVPFSISHKEMLAHVKDMVESGLVQIHPSYDKLLTSLRTAVATEYSLDKEATSYDDIFDAFRLALNFYKRRK